MANLLAWTPAVLFLVLPAAFSLASKPDKSNSVVTLKIVGVPAAGIALPHQISEAVIAVVAAPPSVKNAPSYDSKPYLYFEHEGKTFNVHSGGIIVLEHDDQWDVYRESHIKKITAEYGRLRDDKNPEQCVGPLKQFCDKMAEKAGE